MTTAYERVILKLSGESLAGTARHGYDHDTLRDIAEKLLVAQREGTEIGVVIGGGNLFRGATAVADEMERTTADTMGMLATLMNALALQTVLEALGGRASVFSAIPFGGLIESYSPRKALSAFSRGELLICGGGTGNPFFTTDSAAALRAAELGADVVLKATRVDGVYDRDPERYPDAAPLRRLTYDDVIGRRIEVMDTAAFTICRDNRIPIVVFNLNAPGSILRALRGEPVGSRIAN